MHRWWGSSNDSAKQASERDQRAARRTINNLNLNPLSSDDEEDYLECDTSIQNTSIFNVDGADDLDESVDSNHQEPGAICHGSFDAG